MKILVTGANGQLGRELVHKQMPYEIIGLSRSQLDISDWLAVKSCLDLIRPSLVINTAAYTKVDLAESDLDLAYSANVNGVINLAASCLRLSIPMIHVSTDYVFDGEQTSPYRESDAMNPVGVYAKSKSLAELALAQILPSHVILRVSWVYGLHGSNFVKTIIRLAGEREKLTIVSDQIGCPTSTAGIAEIILTIAEQIRQHNFVWGTYHYCEGPATNWYEFACAIVKLAAQYQELKVKEISPITSKEYPTPAKRPANSVLDCQRLIAQLNITPCCWQDQLPAMIRGLYT